MKPHDVVSSVWIVPGAQQAYSVRQSREAEEYIAVWAVDFMKDCIKELETKNKELQSKLDASNARLDKAVEGLRNGCSCRPGGFTCACCRTLEQIK